MCNKTNFAFQNFSTCFGGGGFKMLDWHFLRNAKYGSNPEQGCNQQRLHERLTDRVEGSDKDVRLCLGLHGR